MIAPTIGRQVWYWPGKVEAGAFVIEGAQPCAATVVFVHCDREVNLQVLDHAGNPHTRSSVPLQQGDGKTAVHVDGGYAEWMPYQKGQAAKTEQLERAAAEG